LITRNHQRNRYSFEKIILIKILRQFKYLKR
jgi:hypothetical protein